MNLLSYMPKRRVRLAMSRISYCLIQPSKMSSETLLAKYATGVVGIDESEKLLAIAKAKNNPGNVEFRQMDLSDNLDLEDESFDIVLSSMVFHFLPSLEKVSAEISRVLKIDGKVVICVQHPLYQYHFRAQETAGKKSEVFRSTVGYFDRKEIIQKTLAGKAWVPVFNRPLEDYMKAFLEKGLALTNFREPEYTDELLAEHPRYKDHKEVPRVVILEFIKLPKS